MSTLKQAIAVIVADVLTFNGESPLTVATRGKRITDLIVRGRSLAGRNFDGYARLAVARAGLTPIGSGTRPAVSGPRRQAPEGCNPPGFAFSLDLASGFLHLLPVHRGVGVQNAPAPVGAIGNEVQGDTRLGSPPWTEMESAHFKPPQPRQGPWRLSHQYTPPIWRDQTMETPHTGWFGRSSPQPLVGQRDSGHDGLCEGRLNYSILRRSSPKAYNCGGCFLGPLEIRRWEDKLKAPARTPSEKGPEEKRG